MKNIFFLCFFMALFFTCEAQPTTSKTAKSAAAVPTDYAGTIGADLLPIASDYPFNIDLKTVDGKIIKSSQILKNGKPSIVLFWLTTCYPCGLELKALKEKYPKWKETTDFNLYAISMDFEKNYPNFVTRVKESAWPFEAYNDVNRTFKDIIPGNLNGLPQVFIFDKKGNIVYHKRKYVNGDEEQLLEQVKKMK